MNRAAFYKQIRTEMFGGKLKQGVVNTLESILYQCQLREVYDYRHIAYIIATAYHESYNTLKNPDWNPPREGYGATNGQAIAHVTALWQAKKIKKNYALPNNRGLSYYGRGYVGITHEENYKRLGEVIGFDLLNHPDEALERSVASILLVEGMKKGLYTGKKLSDYITTSFTDFKNARRIINGTDRADLIADYATRIYQAIIQL